MEGGLPKVQEIWQTEGSAMDGNSLSVEKVSWMTCEETDAGVPCAFWGMLLLEKNVQLKWHDFFFNF